MRKVLLVDDHEIVRAGVRNVLLQLFAPAEVKEAWDESTAKAALEADQFDLTIMDVQMPDTDSIRLTSYIRERYPQNRVLVFSMASEILYGGRFLKAGAMGFVAKSAGLDELCKAIGMVLDNRRYISQTLAEKLASDLLNKERNNPFELLSARELEITRGIMRGKTVGDIAAELSLSVSTVATYKARVFEKLQVKNVIELMELGRSLDISL